MTADMRSVFPFLWQPRGVVSSLESLPLCGTVLQKNDATRAVGGNRLDAHALTVAALAGGKVIGDLRLAATRDDVVIGGIQTVAGCKSAAELQAHYALHRQRFRIPKYRSGTALLLGTANSDNYYHWLVESLPRWPILQAAGWREYDFVLLHNRPCRFQEETLDWLGVPAGVRLRCSKNFIHQFERLVVPAMPFAQRTIPSWVGPWLRSLVPPAPTGPEKVYLSRRDAGGRQLAGEAELEAALGGRGFVSLQPEQLSVAEQARRLGSARFVVGPHGAALTNMVFAPAGALVVEFFHPQHKNRCYENLAAACGHRYASLDGEATERNHERRLEYRIDTADILDTLDRLEGKNGF